MTLLDLAKRNRETDAVSWNKFREAKIVKKIRKKRSQNEEIALLRKAVKDLYQGLSNISAEPIYNYPFEDWYQDAEMAKQQTNTEIE